MPRRRPSSIDRLPKKVRTAIYKWLCDPSLIQAEVLLRTNVLLANLGIDQKISRTALNRYSLRMRKNVLDNRVNIDKLNDRSNWIPLLQQQIGFLSALVQQLEEVEGTATEGAHES